MVANKKLCDYVSKCRSLVETNSLTYQVALWAIENKIYKTNVKNIKSGSLYLRKKLKKSQKKALKSGGLERAKAGLSGKAADENEKTLFATQGAQGIEFGKEWPKVDVSGPGSDSAPPLADFESLSAVLPPFLGRNMGLIAATTHFFAGVVILLNYPYRAGIETLVQPYAGGRLQGTATIVVDQPFGVIMMIFSFAAGVNILNDGFDSSAADTSCKVKFSSNFAVSSKAWSLSVILYKIVF